MAEMFKIWHGSQRWEGRPEIRPARKGMYEHGPGIYCTTSLSRASKYARGPGRIVRFSVDSSIQWLQGTNLDVADVMSFLKQSRYVRGKVKLARDIEEVLGARGRAVGDGKMPAEFLVNLAVDGNCLSGQGAPELAEYLVSKGVGGSLYRLSAVEDWVVLFDPSKIVDWEVLRAADIDHEADALEPVSRQLEEAAVRRSAFEPK